MAQELKLFKKWLSTNDRFPFVYHIGHLLWHEHSHDKFARAAQAWKAYKDGKVFLVQHKVSTGVYEYIAIKKRKPFIGKA